MFLQNTVVQTEGEKAEVTCQAYGKRILSLSILPQKCFPFLDVHQVALNQFIQYFSLLSDKSVCSC